LLRLVGELASELFGPLRVCTVAADTVDRPVASRRDEPADRIVRLAMTGPMFGRSREGFLRGFFGELDGPEAYNERAQAPSPLVAEDTREHAAIRPRRSGAPRSRRGRDASSAGRRRPRAPRPGSPPRQ